jgi:ribonuclease P protein component
LRISSRNTTKTTGNPDQIYPFRKRERLASRKSIIFLFESGEKIDSYPLRVFYTVVKPGGFPAAMAVSVPKKVFKKAVDRNLLKRRIREAYRRNKPAFYSRLKEMNLKVHIIIQYRGRNIENYQTIETNIMKIFDKLYRMLDAAPSG